MRYSLRRFARGMLGAGFLLILLGLILLLGFASGRMTAPTLLRLVALSVDLGGILCICVGWVISFVTMFGSVDD